MSTQHDQDRDRIAEAMNKVQTKSGWTEKEFESLDQAVYAFETLCEPRGWRWMRDGEGDWYGFQPKGLRESVCVSPTGNHAADVCRLVCMVLDREASDAK